MESRSVELRGGLMVRDDALRLAISLEMRGHLLTAKDSALMVSNGSTLSADDRAAIKDCKAHILAILAYEAPPL